MASWLRLASSVAILVILAGPVGAQDKAADMPSALDQECDRLAASIEDPEHLSAGVSPGAMDSLAAAEACRAALKITPGSARLQFEYGRAMLKRGDTAQALEYYNKSVAQNYSAAKVALGAMQGAGLGTEKNVVEAVRLYQEAADAGNEAGRARLALVLLNGNGMPPDQTKGLVLLEQAAVAGNPIALLSLGSFFIRGDHGLPKDFTKGMRLLRQASDSGDPNASALLSRLVRSRDEAEADRLQVRAAEEGDLESIGAMVEKYASGNNGYPKDQIKAIDWVMKAIVAGETTVTDEDRPVPTDVRAVLQLRLKARGVYGGPTDGSPDPGLKAAVKLLSGH